MGAENVIAEIGLDVSEMERALLATIAGMDAADAAAEKLNDTVVDTGDKFEKTGKKSSVSMGNIVNTVMLVGSTLINMGEGANAAFGQAMTGADKFQTSLDKLSTSGGLEQIVGGLEKAKTEIGNLTTFVDGLTKGYKGYIGTVSAMVGMLMGGEGPQAAIEKAGLALDKINESAAKARQRALALAEGEAKINKLRMAGESEKADEMERELKIAQKLAEINDRDVDDYLKGKLSEVAQGDADVDAKKDADKKTKAGEKWVDDMMDLYDKDVKAEDDAIEKKKRNAKKLSDFWAAMERDDAAVRNKDAKKRLDEEEKARKKKEDDEKKARDKATAELTKEANKRIAEMQREEREAERIANKIRNDRIEAYKGGTAAGRKFDRDQKKEEKKREKGERKMEEQDERERKRNPQGNPAPKLGPEKPKPNGQPAPKPAPEPKGNKGMTMTVETLNVKLLQNA